MLGFADWLGEVKAALHEVNMPFDEWQKASPFDFEKEHEAGTKPDDAAMKANRFWWYEQNKRINQDCRVTSKCWLPRNHQGNCQPV